jgi:prolyl-tRNA synthetase
MAKWVQSYRDLPLLLNQWANVVRWELRPRLFLRTTEFLWQEGHTAHATFDDAAAFARKIHLDVYNDFLVSVLALPSYLGLKTRRERFAGAVNTMTLEAMMGDGKALQMGTSHELGQNFARAFNITFQSEEGEQIICHTTSWGSTTRLVGGLIMAHGDDRGLVLPPNLAPTQAVVLAVRDDADVLATCQVLTDQLRAAGVRVALDRGRGTFGRRVTDWEIKGVPVRVEVGPRDLANGVVTVARRNTSDKETVSLDAVAAHVSAVLTTMQRDILAAATERLAAKTHAVASITEAVEAAQDGFARLAWDAVGDEGETLLNQQSLSVRCLQRADGSIPDRDDEPGLVCVVARAY